MKKALKIFVILAALAGFNVLTPGVAQALKITLQNNDTGFGKTVSLYLNGNFKCTADPGKSCTVEVDGGNFYVKLTNRYGENLCEFTGRYGTGNRTVRVVYPDVC